jgi:predicted MFS family arabinose efflux permease
MYGIGIFQPANIASIMQIGDQNEQGSLGSLQRMVQNIAIATGTAIGSTVMNLLSGDLGSGIRINWDITLILVLIIIFLSVFFDKESVLRFFK